jgi:hypothetical protein
MLFTMMPIPRFVAHAAILQEYDEYELGIEETILYAERYVPRPLCERVPAPQSKSQMLKGGL